MGFSIGRVGRLDDGYHRLWPDRPGNSRYRKGGVGYGQAKKRLAELIIDFFKPYREKRGELENNIDYVKDVLKCGGERAKAIAAETLSRVRTAAGLGNRL